MDNLIPLLAAIVVFALIVFVGVLIVRSREARIKRRSLALVAGYASDDPHSALVRAEQQGSLIRSSVVWLGSRLVTPGARRRIERQSLYAGRNDPSAVEDTIIRKVAYMVGVGILGLLIWMLLGGMWWLAIPVGAAVGFFLPDILIYNEGLKREQEVTKRLPDALDLLNLCVESGLSFQAALTQVATNQEGPVAEEFSVALQEMQLGRSRSEALEAMANRTRQEDVQRFVWAMMQVDKLGVPVAAVLREQAREMRAKRYARAREQAQKVPLKILMPLMLCFLPALFVIILGPAVYSIYQVFTTELG
jgi:tight adherence protein C